MKNHLAHIMKKIDYKNAWHQAKTHFKLIEVATPSGLLNVIEHIEEDNLLLNEQDYFETLQTYLKLLSIHLPPIKFIEVMNCIESDNVIEENKEVIN